MKFIDKNTVLFDWSAFYPLIVDAFSGKCCRGLNKAGSETSTSRVNSDKKGGGNERRLHMKELKRLLILFMAISMILAFTPALWAEEAAQEAQQKAPEAMEQVTEVVTEVVAEVPLININAATAAELAGLPGIGESLADAIVKYREENGAFQSVEDLMKVSGVGDNKFEAIKGLISLQ